MMPRRLLTSDLSNSSKILYTIILYLSQSDTGSYYCCPTNEWLTAQLNCSVNSVTKYLKELRDNHYVRVQEDKRLTEDGIRTIRVISLTKISADDMAELEEAYKLFHIEAYDKEMETWADAELTCEEEVDIVDEVITYLNNKAGTSYRAKSKTHSQWINARIKEGYKLDDFKKVIDNKCKEWLYTDMEQYLRPSTLFGNKFDTYLNQVINITDQQVEKRKTKLTQTQAVNPYNTQVNINSKYANQADALSDDWFSHQPGGPWTC